MEQEQSNRFLQLPFTVYQELLLLIRSNPEGIKDVLNLRLVHSKTKDWVDGLSSQSAGKVFTNVKVVINFQEHETDNRLGVVQKFLDRPPEYPVFGLKLIGVTHFMALKQNNAEIHVDCCGGESLFSVSDNQIWKKFCEFWKEKLVYFESDNVDDEILPIDVEIGKLVNSQCLEEYHCYDITRFRPEFVPDSWWKLQVIRVDFISLPSHELPYLFNFFSGNDNLRLLILKSIRVCDLVYLIDLFRSFGDRKQLKIIIWFHFDISHLEYNRLHEFSLEEKRILVDFATMVANTSYCVILKLMEKNLLKFLEDSIVASMQEDFLKSIDWISFFHVNEGDLDLTRYINLRKVNALEFQGVCDVTFPNKLVHLGLVSGVPATFPVSLSCLHLMNIDSSVGELLILVEKIGKNCPKLVCIDLSWKENEKTDSHSGKTMEREILANNYEGLKSLKFTVESTIESQRGSITGVDTVLFEAFGLCGLDLDELVLKNETETPVLLKCHLENIVGSPISQRLSKIEISERFFTHDSLLIVSQFVNSVDSRRRNLCIRHSQLCMVNEN